MLEGSLHLRDLDNGTLFERIRNILYEFFLDTMYSIIYDITVILGRHYVRRDDEHQGGGPVFGGS
jgi:hypothetical protein